MTAARTEIANAAMWLRAASQGLSAAQTAIVGALNDVVRTLEDEGVGPMAGSVTAEIDAAWERLTRDALRDLARAREAIVRGREMAAAEARDA